MGGGKASGLRTEPISSSANSKRSKSVICSKFGISVARITIFSRGTRGRQINPQCETPNAEFGKHNSRNGLTVAGPSASQRDGIIQPRVARNELPWVSSSYGHQPCKGCINAVYE